MTFHTSTASEAVELQTEALAVSHELRRAIAYLERLLLQANQLLEGKKTAA